MFSLKEKRENKKLAETACNNENILEEITYVSERRTQDWGQLKLSSLQRGTYIRNTRYVREWCTNDRIDEDDKPSQVIALGWSVSFPHLTVVSTPDLNSKGPSCHFSDFRDL